MNLKPYERQVLSSNGEDGISEFIFKTIGFESRRSVEFGMGDGLSSCNTSNFVLNYEFEGLFIESEEKFVSKTVGVCEQYKYNAKIVHSVLDINNINSVIGDAGFTGEIDLLSIDTDGLDYYLWKNLTVIQPRVVIIEYNKYFPIHLSYALEYVEDFKYNGSWGYSASLYAYLKLAREKGYTYLGTVSGDSNAFFVQNKYEYLNLIDCCMDTRDNHSVITNPIWVPV